MHPAQPGRHGPPLVGTVDHRSVQPVVEDPGQAEQEGGDPSGALHPGGGGRQQRRLVAVLDEPPPRAGVVPDRAFDQRVTHPARASQEQLGPRWLAGVLRGIEQHVSDPRRAAATSVVVPEAGPEPFRYAGRQHRVQATVPQRRDLEAADLVHGGGPSAANSSEVPVGPWHHV